MHKRKAGISEQLRNPVEGGDLLGYRAAIESKSVQRTCNFAQKKRISKSFLKSHEQVGSGSQSKIFCHQLHMSKQQLGSMSLNVA